MNENFRSFAMTIFRQGGFLSGWLFVMVDFFRVAFCLDAKVPGGFYSVGFMTAGLFNGLIFTWWLFSGLLVVHEDLCLVAFLPGRENPGGFISSDHSRVA